MNLGGIPTFARSVHAVLDTVFPRECPLTGGPPDDSSPFRHLRPEAVRRLPIIIPPCCSRCGAPFYGVGVIDQNCAHCATLNGEFDSGRAVMLARDAGRELIHEFKYRGARHLAEDLGRIATLAPGFIERLENAVLVPVPLHPDKLRRRGFNQSLLLARAFAELATGARVEEVLIRIRNTPSQTILDRNERRANTKNAFAIREGVIIYPTLKHVLVDDVFTTGATLDACGSTLRGAGILRISVATLGHG